MSLLDGMSQSPFCFATVQFGYGAKGGAKGIGEAIAGAAEPIAIVPNTAATDRLIVRIIVIPPSGADCM